MKFLLLISMLLFLCGACGSDSSSSKSKEAEIVAAHLVAESCIGDDPKNTSCFAAIVSEFSLEESDTDGVWTLAALMTDGLGTSASECKGENLQIGNDNTVSVILVPEASYSVRLCAHRIEDDYMSPGITWEFTVPKAHKNP